MTEAVGAWLDGLDSRAGQTGAADIATVEGIREGSAHVVIGAKRAVRPSSACIHDRENMRS
jgi:hypothetical protein